MQKKLLFPALVLILIFFTSPFLVGAQEGINVTEYMPTPQEELPQSLDQVTGVVGIILQWVARAFWLFAVGFIFYSAFLFLTAAGNDERLRKAKQQLWYAIIAIAVALASTVLPTLILNLLGSGFVGPSAP